MNEIVKQADAEIITAERITKYMEAFGIASQLEKGEKEQFIEIATAFQLNPFKREIYCIPYGKGEFRKLLIITGYETYLKRAERTGKMDGWSADIEGSGEDMVAVVTIYRKDWSRPFIHKAYWSECKQTTFKDGKQQLNAMWSKMGKFMLKKVATAQAFRLCFPDEFGGMPYTADELPDNMTAGFNEEPKNITSESSATRTEQPALVVQSEKAEAQTEQSKPESKPADAHMLTEGEVITGWFWKLSAEQRKQYIPNGCKYEKVNGSWTVIKAA